MAIDVRIRSITSLTSGGKTIGGVASNNKVCVVGDIDITIYTSAGEPVSPQALGLKTIDAIFVTVVDVDGVVAAAANMLRWDYDRRTDLLLLTDGNDLTDATTDAQVRFVAFGETAAAPDLV